MSCISSNGRGLAAPVRSDTQPSRSEVQHPARQQTWLYARQQTEKVYGFWLFPFTFSNLDLNIFSKTLFFPKNVIFPFIFSYIQREDPTPHPQPSPEPPLEVEIIIFFYLRFCKHMKIKQLKNIVFNIIQKKNLNFLSWAIYFLRSKKLVKLIQTYRPKRT